MRMIIDYLLIIMLFTQLTLHSICTVLERLLSYSQHSLYFLFVNMLLAIEYMCQ